MANINMQMPKVVAISGVKNSGKTTLITKVVNALTQEGYKVGVIKHDGHEFEADHEGTDSYRHKQAGASSVIIYSKRKMMLIEEHEVPDVEKMISYQRHMDLVILEGMKYSAYPKFEVVRGANSKISICPPETLLGIVTDLPLQVNNIPLIDLNDIQTVIACIKANILERRDTI